MRALGVCVCLCACAATLRRVSHKNYIIYIYTINLAVDKTPTLAAVVAVVGCAGAQRAPVIARRVKCEHFYDNNNNYA